MIKSLGSSRKISTKTLRDAASVVLTILSILLNSGSDKKR